MRQATLGTVLRWVPTVGRTLVLRHLRARLLALVAAGILSSTLVPTLPAQAQTSFAHGTVVALHGTPHLWFADAQGVLHWGGDTRALAGKHIAWNNRIEVTLDRLRTLPIGDPWLSAGLLKDGDPIYLVKWEADWELPQLLHIQSIKDVELFGINGSNYGNFVLDKGTWEQRFGIAAAGLQRGVLAPAAAAAPPAADPPAPPAGPAAEPQAPAAAQVRADWLGINDGYAASGFLGRSGAGWTRAVIFWTGAERSDGDFSGIRGCPWVDAGLRAANVNVLGLLIGTPAFAATNPADGVHSVPDMQKWARFVEAIARECAGTIDHWAIWNEVEIPRTGPNASYATFAGSAAQYYQLLKTAYGAAKQGNPHAKVIAAPYSYHRDMQEGGEQRLPWFEAFMAQVRADPAAPANGGFFDALALNIYRNPHDLWDRVQGGGAVALLPPNRSGFAQRLADMGLAGKPIWLAEFNAMPFDDNNVPGWDPRIANDGFRVTMDEQASFVIQALTLGRLAGYERMFFHALQDDRYPALGGRQFDELWGLVRYHGDPSNVAAWRQRPAFAAFQTVARYLGNATPRGLRVLERADDPVARWSQYTPRYTWHVHAGIFERDVAGGIQRSTVLWNGAGTPITVLLPKVGVQGWIISKEGAAKIVRPVTVGGQEFWSIELAAASRHFDLFGGDPPGYYYVGGSPLILVEEGVPAGAPLTAPQAAS